MAISEDLDALWIGANSDADCVLIQSANRQDPNSPILVAVGAPFIGYLQAPINLWSKTPAFIAAQQHTLQLFGVRGAIPAMPRNRAPKRGYQHITLAANPTVSTSDYIPVFGRNVIGFHFDATNAATQVAVQIQAMLGGDYHGTAGAFPQLANFGGAFNIAAGAQQFLPISFTAAAGAPIPVNYIRINFTPVGAGGSLDLTYEARDRF